MHVVHDHPHGQDVVDLVQRDVLAPGFTLNAVDVLDAALDQRIGAGLVQGLAQPASDRLHDLLASGPLRQQPAGDLAIALGLQQLEGVIFELPAPLLDSQPPRQRREDLQGVAGIAGTLLGPVDGRGLQVVQTVRQLDQHYPDVARHGQKDLPQVLRLAVVQADDRDVVQLGHAVHQLRHVGAEPGSDRSDIHVGVFHAVV